MNIQHSKHSASAKQYWLLLKNGDADALESLYKLYSNALYNYGSKFSIDKDLIKESIQELFVNIWIRREFISHPADVKNYLFKSFRLSVFKKTSLLQKNQEYEETEDYPFSVSLSIEDVIIEGEAKDSLKRKLELSLQGLTDRQKEAIFLKFYENLSYDEIAEVMGISVKATYKIMARSLNFLRENLTKDELLVLLTLFYMKLYN
ncbi:RNA polymerase sigma factor (sigma-70 family) [Pedobacter cryoconitis]|uniref:RNA polymerase sigma factor (Sigma-70 family) n=1 Tax=Pedobacter cryoconitis TaxID=188932 RepID=A0A7W9DX43_9SPHI|nr:sigma-70 family RNA polymerase sigma factor [Pedobacter cryoconitis]MBB5634536.1 RNA polymerase sigma factor (sigma-70 family) [Pedobacter cryoconitis]MBB6272339.1 RNA polymerase sigma factor (sigma-70 family) [Pedobacter cryoconitis]